MYLSHQSFSSAFFLWSSYLKLSLLSSNYLTHHFSSLLSACAFASYLLGKIEITKREIAQLPAISCTDSHCKCTHLFPLAICHIQGMSLLQAKLMSRSSSSVFPHLSSPLEVYSTIIPTLISSLSPLSSCFCQLAHKHTHVPAVSELKANKQKKKKNTPTAFTSLFSYHSCSLFFSTKLFRVASLAVFIFSPLF